MKITIHFNNSVDCVGLPYRLQHFGGERNICEAVFYCGLLVTCRFEVKTTREKGNVAKYYGQDCSSRLSVFCSFFDKFAFLVQPTLY